MKTTDLFDKINETYTKLTMNDILSMPAPQPVQDQYTFTTQLTSLPAHLTSAAPSVPAQTHINTVPSMNYTLPIYNNQWTLKYTDEYSARPVRLYSTDREVEVSMPDGTFQAVSHSEMIKYISERQLIRENDVVRNMYDRYQVAVKLIGSDDNGDTGV